jgi:cbb3-type cytochrome oxidase maturation protein
MNIYLLFMSAGGIQREERAMSILFVFTGLGVLLFIGAVAALIWSIRTGQLDDLDTPAQRMLTDEASPRATDRQDPPPPQEASGGAEAEEAGRQTPAGSGNP